MTSTMTVWLCVVANSTQPFCGRMHCDTTGSTRPMESLDFAVRGLSLDEMAQQVPLVRFQRITLLTARDLTACGLYLEPTGRNPRHYTVRFDDLDEGVKALTSCDHQVMTNPYYDG